MKRRIMLLALMQIAAFAFFATTIVSSVVLGFDPIVSVTAILVLGLLHISIYAWIASNFNDNSNED